MTLPKTATKTVTAIFASMAALAMLPATAESSDDLTIRSVSVSIAGLDLNDPQDVKTVLVKFEKAAKRVCRNSTTRPTPKERAAEMECRTEAVAEVVDRLGSAQLSAALEATNASS
ncbi:MAG: UrcA family protein [Pseudomonadota bacterium]